MGGLILRPERQQGIATVLVLSLVAGLALMVTAMVGTSRIDTQMLSAQREQMQASAYFDGVAHLLMREYLSGSQELALGQSVVFRRNIDFSGKRFEGSVYPLEGLIDLRAAPVNVIQALLSGFGGLQVEYARSLASAIVRFREQGNDTIGGAPAIIDNIDDLMAVPGMRREILDQLGFAMRASGGASPAPNMGMLPAEFAGVFSGASDSSGFGASGNSDFAPAGALGGGAGSLVVQLTMSYDTDSGRRATGHYRVSLDGSQYGMPWRIKRRFPPQLKSASDGGG